jgi:hypothetical protein
VFSQLRLSISKLAFATARILALSLHPHHPVANCELRCGRWRLGRED